MTNEYGAELDRNGYAPSIVNDGDFCFCCLKGGSAFGANLARHEIFGGSRREKSKRLGLWVWLCPTCHAEIHASGKRTLALHHVGQRAAMEYYGWTADEFRERFGVNYL